ncbi:hypothetical protein ACEXTD_003043 [Salmonella enterica]
MVRLSVRIMPDGVWWRVIDWNQVTSHDFVLVIQHNYASPGQSTGSAIGAADKYISETCHGTNDAIVQDLLVWFQLLSSGGMKFRHGSSKPLFETGSNGLHGKRGAGIDLFNLLRTVFIGKGDNADLTTVNGVEGWSEAVG